MEGDLMSASNVASGDAAQASLTHAVFAVKNAVEDRDAARLRELFVERPEICIQGRFVALPEFLERMAEFFTRVEHIAMDVTRIEEIDEKVAGGFIAAAVDFGWIDAKLWEEQQMHGVLALTLAPQKTAGRPSRKGEASGDEQRAGIAGFAYNAMALDANGGGDGGGDGRGGDGGGVGPQPGPSPSRGGYSFWG
jgi:hypothetical protein